MFESRRQPHRMRLRKACGGCVLVDVVYEQVVCYGIAHFGVIVLGRYTMTEKQRGRMVQGGLALIVLDVILVLYASKGPSWNSMVGKRDQQNNRGGLGSLQRCMYTHLIRTYVVHGEWAG